MGLVYISGTEPNSAFIVGLEYNSICLNGDIFQIYSGGREKRKKITHRTGASFFFFSFFPSLLLPPQFSMRNHVDSSF